MGIMPYTMKNLKHSPMWYTPEHLSHVSARDVRAEYSRMRSIVNKRLARMDNTIFEHSETYQQYRDYFKPVRSLSPEDLQMRLSDAAKILREDRCIKTMRAGMNQRIETMRNNGIDFIDESNYFQFVQFMEAWRAAGYDRMYDSGDDAARAFKVVMEKHIDPMKIATRFDDWMNNREAIENYVDSHPTHGEGINYEQMQYDLTRAGQWKTGEQYTETETPNWNRRYGKRGKRNDKR